MRNLKQLFGEELEPYEIQLALKKGVVPYFNVCGKHVSDVTYGYFCTKPRKNHPGGRLFLTKKTTCMDEDEAYYGGEMTQVYTDEGKRVYKKIINEQNNWKKIIAWNPIVNKRGKKVNQRCVLKSKLK